MRGYSHALSGAAAWMAIASSSQLSTGAFSHGPQVALAGAIVMAGAALLPDCDHPQGTIAHSLPGLEVGPRGHEVTLVPSATQILCSWVCKISGGHRHATHSLIGVGAFTIIAWVVSLVTWTIPDTGRVLPVGAGLLSALLIAFASKAIGINWVISRQFGRSPVASLISSLFGSWLGPWMIALGGAAALTWWMDERWAWLPFAVGFGTLVHILGDALTIEGVPFLWPWNPAPPKGTKGVLAILWQRNGYFRFPILGHTTSFREAVFATFLGLYAGYLTIFEGLLVFGMYDTAALLL